MGTIDLGSYDARSIFEKIESTDTVELGDNLKTGYAPQFGDAIVQYSGIGIENQAVDQISAISLSGLSEDNSDAGKLYVKITGTTDAVVELYSDVARTSQVAEGTVTRSSGGVITLDEEGGSGLSGSCTIIAGATNEVASNFFIDKYIDKYDADNTLNRLPLGVVYEVRLDDAVMDLVTEGRAPISKVGASNLDDIKEEIMINAFRSQGFFLV